MRLLTRLARKGSDLRNVLVAGGGGGVAQAVNFLCLPVITRLYTPAEYGSWVLLISLVATLGTIAAFRYELAVVLPESQCEAANVFALTVLLSGLWAGLSGGLLLFAGGRVLSRMEDPALAGWLWAAIPLIALTGIVAACHCWCTREKAFGVSAAAYISLAAFTNGTQILLALLGFTGMPGLILGTLVGQAASVLLLGVSVVLLSRSALVKGVSWKGIRSAAAKYKNFPLYTVPYTIVGLLRERAAVFLLGAFAPREAVGYYGFSYRLMMAPVTLLSNGLRPVLFQKAARTPAFLLHAFVDRLHALICLCATPVLIAFLFFAEDLFRLAFGDEWLEAAPYARLFCVATFCFVYTGWLDRLFDVKGKQRLALQLEAGFSTATILAFWSVLAVSRNALHAVAIQVAILACYYMVHLCVAYRISEFPVVALVRLIRRVVVLSAAYGLLILALSTVFGPLTSMALFALAVAGVSFVFAKRWVLQYPDEAE